MKIKSRNKKELKSSKITRIAALKFMVKGKRRIMAAVKIRIEIISGNVN